MIEVSPQLPYNTPAPGPARSGRDASTANISDRDQAAKLSSEVPQLVDPNILDAGKQNSVFDLNGPYIPKNVPTAQRWLKTGLDYVNRAFGSSKGLCTGIVSQAGSWITGILRNPTALAWTSGIGAFAIAIMSLKNIFHGLNVALGRRESSDELPSAMYLFQGLLQGGLTAALLSNIVGWRNPFTETKGDRLVVSNRMMVGGLIAPALMALWIKLAQGNTFLNRLPFLGTSITAVAKAIPNGFNGLFRSDEKTVPSAATAGQGAPQAA